MSTGLCGERRARLSAAHVLLIGAERRRLGRVPVLLGAASCRALRLLLLASFPPESVQELCGGGVNVRLSCGVEAVAVIEGVEDRLSGGVEAWDRGGGIARGISCVGDEARESVAESPGRQRVAATGAQSSRTRRAGPVIDTASRRRCGALSNAPASGRRMSAAIGRAFLISTDVFTETGTHEMKAASRKAELQCLRAMGNYRLGGCKKKICF